QLRDALLSTPARRLVALNLAPQPGETAGFSPERHLEVLAEHVPGLRLDVVLADGAVVGDAKGLRTVAEELCAELVLAPLAACGAATGTSSASSRTARPSPGRPACSTAAAARCGACRRRWSAARRATPRPPGAAPSWPTAPSPSPAARRRWRSPVRGPRLRSR